MGEFIQKNYSALINIVEFLAAITGLIFYKKYKITNAKYFIWFLVYINVCEIIGSYTGFVNEGKFLNFLKGTVIEKNHWWSTLFWKIGAIVFFAFYYNQVLNNKKFKKIISISTLGFIIFSVLYISWNWKTFFNTFFPIISVLGAIIIFLCTVFYFIEVLSSDKLLSFYKSINFYISAAIFIWWLIITPIVFYDNYLSYKIDVYERDWNYINLRRFIYLFSNIFMYSTFTFALIFCEPEIENEINN
jgi:hypothetical protein